MAATMNVPGIGSVNKTYVYAGGALVVGVVGYAYYKRRQQDAQAAQDATATDAGTSTDMTGQSDTGALYEPPVNYDPGSYDYSMGGSVGGYSPPYYYSPGSPSAPTIATDAAWFQAAVSWLEQNGADSQAASAALGNYMHDICVSSAQADLVRQAEGALGRPPQTSHNIAICAPSTGGGGTTDTTTPSAPSGLHVTGTSSSSVSLAWNKTAHATHYRVYRSGVPNNIGDTTGTTFTVHGLKRKTHYTFHVRAWNGTKMGAASHSVSVRTK